MDYDTTVDGLDPDAHGDAALVGELDRVANQVHKDLAQTAWIADQTAGHFKTAVFGVSAKEQTSQQQDGCRRDIHIRQAAALSQRNDKCRNIEKNQVRAVAWAISERMLHTWPNIFQDSRSRNFALTLIL